ncbi:glycerol-3-phosphate dehydrogenase [Paraburkholderia sp. B3]|uniref:glycerol-3-phosphate dehydrogenase n=1 Tax=Paraburkholderia sp. B3 TaxID=3134791 RepID=UPI003981CCB0
MSQQNRYDLLVVGGGINGAGIARDAAGRGLSVLLCEQDDLASHTSSASTKLIHGGLRYLEYKEFGLVRKALQERETLLRAAPHIMWPLRFVMPHMPNLRPAWLIRVGLFLYDHLAKRELLPGSRGIDMRRHPAGAPLVDSIRRGFVYSDGWVNDARLVVLNAMDAKERGAEILTRTKLVSARRANGAEWQARLQRADGSVLDVRARAIANAAGPWVGEVLHGALGRGAQHSVRLVKGSHIVTKRLFEHDHAYIFQNPDKRIIFAIPYEHDFTLIGTTDVEYHNDPAQVAIDGDETRYLCDSINRYFKRKISPADVYWTYSGVRPLLEEEGADNPAAVTRDYKLELDEGEGAPLLSVFGGKITTFRKLAEEASDLLCRALGSNAGTWTAGAPLPGGDMANARFEPFEQAFAKRHAWLPAPLLHRYARAYGTRASRVVGDAVSLAGLGEEIAPGIYEAELRYLRDAEWATCAQDVLWRRSKLGLHIAPDTFGDVTAAIDAWFGVARAAAAPAAQGAAY